jgi:hypothetical protein
MTNADPIENVVRTGVTNWDFEAECGSLQERLSKLFGACDEAYALPVGLIAAMQQEGQGFFTAGEIEAERQLAALCDRYNAVGIISRKAIPSSFLNPPPPVSITREQFQQHGWDQFGAYEDVIRQIEQADQRADPFRQQAAAYIGWLLTNPAFLREVRELRQTEQLAALPPSAPSESLAYANFCQRWQLSGMASWDLPVPQGPILTSVGLPATVASQDTGFQFSFPVTMRLPARLDIRAVHSEIRETNSPPHLAEWQQILSQEGKQDVGLARFADILPLHFYRNIALGSRYSARFPGWTEWLDKLFARFLDNRSEDSVKKLRLAVEKRLRAS